MTSERSDGPEVAGCGVSLNSVRVNPDTRADAPLRDLRDRLSEKALTLTEMADGPGRRASERVRLRGKAEGVDLALSFVEEMLREQ